MRAPAVPPAQPWKRYWDRWLMMALIGLSVGAVAYFLHFFIHAFAMIKYHGTRWVERGGSWGAGREELAGTGDVVEEGGGLGWAVLGPRHAVGGRGGAGREELGGRSWEGGAG